MTGKFFRLYSSVVERQSCKLEVRSSILREGIVFFVQLKVKS